MHYFYYSIIAYAQIEGLHIYLRNLSKLALLFNIPPTINLIHHFNPMYFSYQILTRKLSSLHSMLSMLSTFHYNTKFIQHNFITHLLYQFTFKFTNCSIQQVTLLTPYFPWKTMLFTFFSILYSLTMQWNICSSYIIVKQVNNQLASITSSDTPIIISWWWACLMKYPPIQNIIILIRPPDFPAPNHRSTLL